MKSLQIFKKAALVLLAVCLIFGFTACGANDTPQSDTTDPAAVTAEKTGGEGVPTESVSAEPPSREKPLVRILKNSVDVLDISLYTGRYIENGVPEQVENVPSLKLKNNGSEDIRLLELEVTANGEKYLFSVTGFLSGSTVTVPEKNATACTGEFTPSGINVTEASFFRETPSLHEDSLACTVKDGKISLTNKSERNLSETYIYYKEQTSDGFFGGITYRLKAGFIAAGEEKLITAESFDPSVHKIIFTEFNEK